MPSIRPSSRAAITAALALPLVAIVLAAAAVVRVQARARDAGEWVRHTDAVLAANAELLTRLVDTQAAQRGFLLTGDPAFRAQFEAGRAPADSLLAALRRLTADNPLQQRRLDTLAAWRAARRDLLREGVAQRGAGAVPAGDVAGLARAEQAATDALRALSARLGAEERRLLVVRQATLARAERDLYRTLAVSGALLALSVLASVLYLVRHARYAREQAAHVGMLNAELSAQNATLEDQAWRLEEQATELEVALEQLQAREARDRLLLDGLRDGVLLQAGDGRVLDANASAGRILGVPPEQLHDRAALALLSEESGAPLPAEALPWAVALRTGRPQHDVPLIVQRPDGELLWLLVNAVPLRGDDAEAAVVTSFTDVTEQRRSEAALRTTETQLRQAQKMEAIGQLAGGLAHDYNNQLTVISSYAQLLEDGLGAADPLREELAEIRGATARAAALTRQLLTFSRQQVAAPTAVDLSHIVAGMQSMIARLLGARIRVVARLADDLPRCLADAGQLEQVLMNLVVNARDAMGDGGELCLATSPVALAADSPERPAELAPGAYVCLSVADTGTGIDPETQARIFEPFFTTKPVGQGTGLGLAVVYGIVRQAGGAIALESAPGVGTTIRIYLPVVGQGADGRLQPA